MSSFAPLSDSRHAQLIKAAEDVVDLIGDGVDPQAAFLKTAADHGLNDNEAKLMGRSVNNVLALQQVLHEDPKQRGDAVPLINVDECTAKHAAARDEVRMRKVASADLYEDHGTYYVGPSTSAPVNPFDSYVAPVRKVAGVPKLLTDTGFDLGLTGHDVLQLKRGADLEITVTPGLYQKKASQLRLGIAELREQREAATLQATQLLNKVASALSSTTFPTFEKHASVLGVSQDVLDELHSLVGGARASTLKGIVKVATSVAALADDCLRAETMLDHAADVEIALEDLTTKYAAAEKGSDLGGLGDFLGPSYDVAKGSGRVAQEFVQLPGGLDVTSLMGGPTAETAEADDPLAAIGPRSRITNARVKGVINSVLADEVISGYLQREPERVAEALNVALRSGANSPGVTAAIVRNHLATGGAVPAQTYLELEKMSGKGQANGPR